MIYSYTAIDGRGNRSSGEIEAESVKAAADILRSQSLLPVKIEQSKGVRAGKFDIKNIFGRVKLVEKVTFIRNLATMLKAGFPASRALNALVDQTNNPTFKAVLTDVAAGVDKGQSLADAMSRHPKVFTPVFISVVRVGEVSGNLETSLFNLAVQLQKDYEIIKKTRGALIYPGVILSLMFIVSIIMFTFVLPKLTELFAEFDVELPLITRAIIAVVNFMESFGLLVALAVIAAIVGFVISIRNPKIKHAVDRLTLRTPVVGKLVAFTNVARFARILSSLLHSGMPILESVKVTSDALGNTLYKDALAEAEKAVRSGATLSSSMRNQPKLFPPLVISMLTVGEESGTIDTLLTQVADFYEGEVDQAVSNFSSILEPALMVIVGVGVGILAAGLILPIYNLTEAI